MIVACLSHTLEELPIYLQGTSKMLESLLVALEGQVGFAKLRMCDDKQEDALIVNCHEHLAQR